MSKSENVELKSRLSKYSDCVQLLIPCVCVNILKTKALCQGSGVQRWKLPKNLACGIWGLGLVLLLLETEYYVCIWLL